MTALRSCAGCGVALSGDSAQGLCPQCQLPGGPQELLPGDSAEPSALTGSVGLARTADWGAPIPVVRGGVLADLAPAELAAHFPALEILGLIGRGGMGAVYKARQTRLDRLVALKILPPEAGRDPAFAERFTREARTLARLNHPNIIAVYDFGESNGLYYFVMEFADGGNLRQAVHPSQPNPSEALRLIPQVCEALQYAHEEGVVHRDIKPENILLDSKGRVKVADFGLAKLLGGRGDARLTGTYQVMGTLNYMAPEQVERPLAVDHRADIYSLGVVCYELLLGELPLGRFPLPSSRAGIDPRLDDVVLRALEKDPAQRYQHAADFRTALTTVALDSVPTVPIGTRSKLFARNACPIVAEPAGHESPGRWLAITTVVAAVLCVLGAAAAFLPWSTTFAATGVVSGSGLDAWHGQAAAVLFLVLGMSLLAVGKLERALLWRPIAMLGAGAGAGILLVLYMNWVAEPKPLPPPPNPARAFQDVVGGLEKFAPGIRAGAPFFETVLSFPGTMMQEIKQPGQLLAGAYVALAAALGLLLLGALQLRLWVGQRHELGKPERKRGLLIAERSPWGE